jgi:glycosyltransferase involved in cell wall biosynthesis
MRLWYEVTSLLHGTAPGAAAPLLPGLLDRTGDRLRCCGLSPRGGFLEVPAAAVDGLLARKAPAPTTSAPAGPAPPLAARFGGVALAVGRVVYPRLPDRLRPTPDLVAAALRRLGSARARLARVGRRLVPARPASPDPPGLGAPVEWSSEDVLISTGPGAHLPEHAHAVYDAHKRNGLRFVPYILDLAPWRFPQFFEPVVAESFVAWLADVSWSSVLGVVASEHLRSEFFAFTSAAGTPAPRVESVRPGDDLPDPTADTPAPGLADGEPFALSVAPIEARHNHLILYHLWRRLAERHGERLPRLVFAGSPGWRTADLLGQMRDDPLTRGKIIVLDDLSRGQAEWLYRRCLWTFCPSHDDGWGGAVADSLCRGKFCIAADAPAAREVGGALPAYHDPLDLCGLQRLAEQALFEPGFLAAREEQIRRDYRPATWGDATAALLRHVDRHHGAGGGTP